MVEHREAEISRDRLAKVAHPDDDPLPEWEELTPEILQDECLRGDFVIRWAVVLLAVLLGWVYLTETSVLLAVRTGEATLRRGGIPLRVDPFSASAEGRGWTNLHWLSDVVLAVWHAVAGMPGLTLLCAACAGATWWLLTGISAKNESKWWPSYCAGLALVATLPMLQPGETSVSLLGMALLLRGLHLWVQSPGGRLRWQLPLLFLFWANMDSRAWLGMAVLLAFALGSLVTRLPQLKSSRGQTWIMTALCLVAGLLVNPWPLAQLFSASGQVDAVRRASVYGIQSEFFPGLSNAFPLPGRMLPNEIFVTFCWVLMGLALLTMILNIMRLELRWPLMWLTAVALSTISGETACMAALVSAVTAAVNGQAWYRRNFTMDYRIDRWSVFTGRAGRAITVLALFFIAYLGINGALLGPQGRRIGLGLDPRWRSRIESLKLEVLPRMAGNKVFPMLPVQGDLLIWLGQKPFIDSRIPLYLKGGEDLVDLHVRTRQSVLAPVRPEDDGIDPLAWKEALLRFQIPNVQVRLWGDQPGYTSLIRMFQQRDWTVTAIGAASANFVRNDLDDAALKEHVAKFRADDFPKLAFRPDPPPQVVNLTGTWAYAPSTYNDWLVQKLLVTPGSAQLGQHYLEIIRQLSAALSAHQVAALSTLAMRQARAALEINPNDPLAWRVVQNSAGNLQQMENAACVAAGNPQLPYWRRFQVRAGVFNAARAGSRSPRNLLALAQFLFDQKEIDHALSTLQLYEDTFGPLSAEQQAAAGLADVYRLRPQLEKYVADTRQEVAKAQAAGTDSGDLVRQALAARMPELALSLMQADPTKIQAPDAQLLYATLLMECGDVEGAYVTINNLRPTMERTDLPADAQPLVQQWKNMAAEIHMATGDVSGASKLWEPQPWSTVERRSMTTLLGQPFGTFQSPLEADLWSPTAALLAANALGTIPDLWAQSELRIALAEITSGQLPAATTRLENVIARHPNFSYRGVVGFYLAALTNKPFELAPPPGPYTLPLVQADGSDPSRPPSPDLPKPLP